MAVKKRFIKKIINNESAQAIFEVLIFMPILVFLYTVIFKVGSSINISINQQKVARRYFYYLVKGNSYLPGQLDLQQFKANYTFAGMSMIGYRRRSEGNNSVAPCFRFNTFLTGETDETCVDAVEGEQSTSFIRVYTGYGICGDTYSLQDNNHWLSLYSQQQSDTDPRSSSTNCAIRSN